MGAMWVLSPDGVHLVRGMLKDTTSKLSWLVDWETLARVMCMHALNLFIAGTVNSPKRDTE